MAELLSGNLSSPASLSGKLSAKERLLGKLSLTPSEYYEYEGSYEVTPKVGEQVLPTADRLLVNDLVVHGVPIYETTNLTGGTTVYIAKED